MIAIGHVNPNRMELLRLKRRRELAVRGHKLLKDKQEQLMRVFTSLLSNIRILRSEVEAELKACYTSFLLTAAPFDPVVIDDSIRSSAKVFKIQMGFKPLMNLRVPSLEVNLSGGDYGHGLAQTPAGLDEALLKYEKLVPKLIKLAESEKVFYMVAAELIATRRRVGALEHIFIPSVTKTIRSITSKLSELERSSAVRLMKVKDIVRKH